MTGDKEVDYEEVRKVEDDLNGEVRQFRRMFQIGTNYPNQIRRMNSAIKTTNCRPPPLVLLQKDHKKRKISPP